MTKAVALDTGPLGKIAHPRPDPELWTWCTDLLAAGTTLILPEVVDYELRRNLLLHGFTTSLARLDSLKRSLTYLPLTTDTMLLAAQLWADARRRGRPTAHPHDLDCDVILAAQALEAKAVVVTENAGHLGQFVTARHWRQIARP
jgi:predicted nucleic acid-binding protein